MTSPTPRPWMLEECTLACARQFQWNTAILPFGATEPHNLHLPFSTDTIEAVHLAEACCAKAWELGGRVVQLPVIPYGTETNMNRFPWAMNLMPTTVFAILKDLVQSLSNFGIEKLVIFNSHGGNEFKPMMRELYGQTNVQLFLCNWYQMIRDAAAQICEHAEDHAGEMETSVVMAFRPDLVRMTPEGKLDGDDGAVRKFQFQALEKGWVSITRPWHLLTTNSGSGYPHLASQSKGQQLTAEVVSRVAPFLAELSQTSIGETFPFA